MKEQPSRIPALIIIYVVLVSGWFVSWLMLGDKYWWLILVNRVVPYLFLPVPCFLAWSIFARNFKPIIPLLIPILILEYLYHPYLFPIFVGSDETGSRVRVMTYNVLFANVNYNAVANLILTYHPDLVALQEVQPEMMDALEERLGTDYPYSRMGSENDFGTTAIFSRHPFTDAYVLDLHVDRPAVVVKTKVHDQEITFVAVHLRAYGLWWVKLKDIPAAVVERTSDQNRQVEILLQQMENQNGIVILGCDCNSKETSSSYRILDQSLNNAARHVDLLLKRSESSGVRPDIALQHLDYVWYRGPLEPLGVYTVNESAGSDHLPVLASFALK